MQHDKLSEQVFDSLVEELVTGQHPPDLSARILAACQKEKTVGHVANHPEIRLKPAVVNRLAGYRVKLMWAAAAAACLMLAVVGWKWVDNSAGQPSGIAQQNAADSAQADPVNDSESLSPALAKATPVTDKSEANPTQAGAVEKIDAPFALDSDLVVDTGTASPSVPSSRQRLTSTQIVEELDRRMSELWRSVDVAPAPASSPQDLAQRISLVLTGQQLSESQVGQYIDAKKQQLNKEALISSAVDSMAFERSWSQRLVQLWLGRSTQGEAESALVESLANRLSGQKQWNLIVTDLIGGELGKDSLSNRFLSLLASGENHRLVECIGKNFLNQQLTCLRCHRQPDSENTPTNQQAAYWSMVALLKGVESQGPNQLVKDRQLELFAGENAARSQPGVYFELPSGVLKQAFAQLPNGKDWRSDAASVPRESLGKWIGESSELDKATVNSMWQLVFGRPLVPLVPTVDAVGLEHRQQLLDFLAGQFDSADHDLRQLASWIVSSRSFASQSTQLSRDQWQQTTQQQLESQQLAALVFAAGTQPATAPERKRLQENLNFVVQWRTASKPNTLLAQPAQLEPGKRASQRNKIESPFSSHFVVHGLRHTAAEQAYVDRLLRAEKLTWAARVQHVVGLSSLGLANDDIQYAAKELLQQHSGDTRSALLDLLWAVQSSQL